MLVNSAVEISPHDPKVRKTVVREFLYIEAFFHRCVSAGQKNGTITSRPPAEQLAKLLLSVLLGIRVLVRTSPQREALKAAVAGVLGLLQSEGKDHPYDGALTALASNKRRAPEHRRLRE